MGFSITIIFIIITISQVIMKKIETLQKKKRNLLIFVFIKKLMCGFVLKPKKLIII